MSPSRHRRYKQPPVNVTARITYQFIIAQSMNCYYIINRAVRMSAIKGRKIYLILGYRSLNLAKNMGSRQAAIKKKTSHFDTTSDFQSSSFPTNLIHRVLICVQYNIIYDLVIDLMILRTFL